jgi:hypothetical protein
MGDLDTASLLLSVHDGIFISSVRATATELVVRSFCHSALYHPTVSASNEGYST